MEQIATYAFLFGIIVIVGQFFNKSKVPIPLILVVVGMLLGFLPKVPQIRLNPDLVLDVFLPLLVYEVSAFSSWKEYKKNIRPITLLSIGHVVFITILVAVVIHTLIPQLGWPLSFVLGAVLSPPDDVAIIAIAEKIRMPERIVTILEGEGIFNDAMALILFRFALAVVVTHQFIFAQSAALFILDVVGEILYGLLLGYVLGELRAKITNSMLHVIASLVTPFIAYLPAIYLGGCGVLAVAVTGFIIGNHYSLRFTPEFRLISRALWPALSFALQSIILLLVGLNLRSILESISAISLSSLFTYSAAVILTVILGRFFWVFVGNIYLPRLLFPSINKKDPYPPWQYPFLISWAGMRGGISLAAALAVPLLPATVEGANPRDLIIFLVFSVILITLLVQGLSLPWVMKMIGVPKLAAKEDYHHHLLELNVRLRMTRAVLRWLREYKKQVKDNPKLLDEVKLYWLEYQMIARRLKETIAGHDGSLKHDEKEEFARETFLLTQLVEVEKNELLDLWNKDKINLTLRNKLLEKLDHRIKHLPS